MSLDRSFRNIRTRISPLRPPRSARPEAAQIEAIRPKTIVVQRAILTLFLRWVDWPLAEIKGIGVSAFSLGGSIPNSRPFRRA